MASRCPLACGSMVLAIVSVFRFSLVERKTKNKKKKSTAANDHVWVAAYVLEMTLLLIGGCLSYLAGSGAGKRLGGALLALRESE